MRLLKMIIGILLLLILIGALIFLGLAYFIDLNRLKPTLINEVRAQTGYQLAIEGDITWALYPRLGIRMPRMIFSADQHAKPFAELHEVTVTTALTTLFRRDHGKADVRIKTLIIERVRATDAHFGVKWRGNKLQLTPIVATFYGGKLTGSATGENLAINPQWGWDIKVTDLQLQPLLEDVHGENRKIKFSGLANVTLKATTMGRESNAFIRNLKGQATLSVKGGAFEGIDLNALIRNADRLLNKTPSPQGMSTETSEMPQAVPEKPAAALNASQASLAPTAAQPPVAAIPEAATMDVPASTPTPMAASALSAPAVIAAGIAAWMDGDAEPSPAAAVASSTVVRRAGHPLTRFDRLTGTAQIQQGLVSTDDLFLQSSLFSATAQGTYSLLLQTMQFRMQVSSHPDLRVQWRVPVEIAGSLQSPVIQVDLGVLRKRLLREEVSKVRSKAAEELRHVPAQAHQLLRNLLER